MSIGNIIICRSCYNRVMDGKGELANWLEKKYIQWLTQVGRRTQGEFADYLGLEKTTFNQYLNGKRTKIDYLLAFQIASKLGDYSIMEILGYEMPSG
jgi:hypothetical protein